MHGFQDQLLPRRADELAVQDARIMQSELEPNSKTLFIDRTVILQVNVSRTRSSTTEYTPAFLPRSAHLLSESAPRVPSCPLRSLQPRTRAGAMEHG